MSLRHHRDRDVRMHDPHPPHPLAAGPPQGPPGQPGPPGAPPPHAVHLNGSVPSTPAGMTNGHAHAHPAHGGHPPAGMSPVVTPAGPAGGAVGGGHTNGVVAVPGSVHPAIQKLTKANEETWLLIGAVAEQIGDLDRALSAYENALRHNPHSLAGLTQVAGIARIRENYTKAIEYFQRVLQFQQDNGEVWSALGHCYLMQDDLQKAYSAYQQALYLLPNPKEDPKLWYGIGILYDRYGSLDHAEEAFASVLQMDKDFDKANEILFRLGIIYKQQGKYQESLECFDRILRNPPSPLAHADIWFQIGHVYEQQKDHVRAKDAYERVVQDNPHHAKVLQQLGWLYHQDGSSFQNQDLAITYLTKSLEADPSDAQSWYLLGRAYMAGQKYNKAYEAYQQAVYRDGRNPTFWCSIGVLYFQINQYRDALDAYSRAIRINPYISEVWFDLGSLYESCNNQISDAIDAYARASELDPSNQIISQRLQLLRNAQQTGGSLPAAPGPQDVHPTAYASAVGPPMNISAGGPPLLMSSGPTPRPIFQRTESREHVPEGGMALPSPHQAPAPPPFRGGPPPPVVLDERRAPPPHAQLAPMDVDRPTAREQFPPREHSSSRGPGPAVQHQNLLLHHPQTNPQSEHYTSRDPRSYRSHRSRSPTPPPPPPPQARRGDSLSSYQPYPPAQNGNGNGVGPRGPALPPPAVPSQRSPRTYAGGPYDQPPAASPPPPEPWERRSTRPRRDSDRSGALPPYAHAHSQSRPPTSPASVHQYDSRPPSHPPSRRNTNATPPTAPMMAPRAGSPAPVPSRSHSMHINDRSPITGPGTSGPGGQRWPPSGRFEHEPVPSPRMQQERSPHSPAMPPQPPTGRRYDPRFDDVNHARAERFDREHVVERNVDREGGIDRGRVDRSMERGYERHIEREQFEARSHAGSPEMFRSNSAVPRGIPQPPPPPVSAGSSVPTEYASPYSGHPEVKDKRRGRGGKDKDSDTMSMRGPPTPVPGQPGPSTMSQTSTFSANGDPAKDKQRKRRARGGRTAKDGTDSTAGSRAPSTQPVSFKVMGMGMQSPPSPEPRSSVSGTGSSSRSGRPSPTGINPVVGLPRREVDEDYDEGVAESLVSLSKSASGPVSPTVSVGGRSRPVVSQHPTNRSPQMTTLKRSHSPAGDQSDSKRTKVGIASSPPNVRQHTPQQLSRQSPIPFHQQPTRSPDDRSQNTDVRMHDRSPSSLDPSRVKLPPPPSAAVVSSSAPNPFKSSAAPSAGNSIALPKIETLSEPRSPSSPGARSPTTDSDQMQVDAGLGGLGGKPNSNSNSHSPPPPPPVAPPSSTGRKMSDMMNSGPGSAGGMRRNSGSVAGSPTNTQSQGNATRSPPQEKTGSPRS